MFRRELLVFLLLSHVVREVHSGRGNPGHPVGRNATPLDSHEEKRQPSQVPNEKAGCGEDFRRSLVGAASPALSRVAGTVVNVTHVLLPLAPLAVEVPTITAHARVVWPWLRAVWPFGFVPTPHWLPVQHLGSQFSTPRYGERRLRSHTVTHGFASRSLSRGHEAIRCCSCDAPSFRMAACGNVGGEHEPTLDCSRAAHRSHGPRDRRSVLSAAGVRLATVAVAAVVTSGTSAARTASAYPSELGTVEQQVEHDDGLSLKSKPGFGSKAFTRDSYDSFASGYDDLDGGWAASAMRIEELRSELLSRARGRVLEVGVGTGLNLRHYRRQSVSTIDAIDLSSGMLAQASARSASLGLREVVRLQEMDVENLKFPSDCFDTVVDTFSLCVFTDPTTALREMARVCKPEGHVLLLENRLDGVLGGSASCGPCGVRLKGLEFCCPGAWACDPPASCILSSKSSFGPLAAYQDLTATFVAKGGGKGCFWNQDVEALAREAGLRVESSSSALPGGLFRTLVCVPAQGR